MLQEEVTNRHQNRLERRKNRAGFPFAKTLNQFEFNFRPKLKKRVFQTYTEPRFVTQAKDLILIGPPGTGKTHLSVGIGLAQIKNDFKVTFRNVQSLAGELQGAERRDSKDELLEGLLKADLLILDEFAGSSQQLEESLLVNPYNPGQVAKAIKKALQMPKDEKEQRWHQLRKKVKTEDLPRWAENFLTDLEDARQLHSMTRFSFPETKPERGAIEGGSVA